MQIGSKVDGACVPRIFTLDPAQYCLTSYVCLAKLFGVSGIRVSSHTSQRSWECLHTTWLQPHISPTS